MSNHNPTPPEENNDQNATNPHFLIHLEAAASIVHSETETETPIIVTNTLEDDSVISLQNFHFEDTPGNNGDNTANKHSQV